MTAPAKQVVCPGMKAAWASWCAGLGGWATRVRARLSWSPRLELPAWRWARNFEWISGTHYEGRAVLLRNKNKEQLLSQVTTADQAALNNH